MTAGFVGYDKDGHFVHYCHCGLEASFGFNVSLRHGQLGTWFCSEHRPSPTPPPKATPTTHIDPAQGKLF